MDLDMYDLQYDYIYTKKMPSTELTYPTRGKGTSTSRVPW